MFNVSRKYFAALYFQVRGRCTTSPASSARRGSARRWGRSRAAARAGWGSSCSRNSQPHIQVRLPLWQSTEGLLSVEWQLGHWTHLLISGSIPSSQNWISEKWQILRVCSRVTMAVARMQRRRHTDRDTNTILIHINCKPTLPVLAGRPWQWCSSGRFPCWG